jgi:hypothetical protein
MDGSGLLAVGVTSLTAMAILGASMWHQKYRQDPINESEEEQVEDPSIIVARQAMPGRSIPGSSIPESSIPESYIPIIFSYEAVTLSNNTKVYMVTETLSDEWTKMVEFLSDICDSARQYGIALRNKHGGTTVDSSWDDFLNLTSKLTESDIRLLLGIPSGLAGLQMVTRNQNVSWSDSRYITYVLKSEPIGPFQHTSLSPKASDGNTVMQFFTHYRSMLMIMSSVDVLDTPFFFNRGITRLPPHVLEGERKLYPDMSMLLHAYTARMAVKRRASTEWLIVSPIDSMSRILSASMSSGIDYFEKDDIPVQLQPGVKKITSSYFKGGLDVDTIIRVSSLLREKSG